MLDFGIISEINSSFLCVVGDACNGTVVAEEFITILATGESILDEVICVLHVNVDISTGGVCEFIDNISSKRSNDHLIPSNTCTFMLKIFRIEFWLQNRGL